MVGRRTPSAFFSLALVTSLLAAPSARADTEVCLKAYADAQRLRKDAKLLESRKELLVCSQDDCATMLRKDCSLWLGEVNEQIPALAVRVVGPDGCDRPDAAISVDDADVAGAAEGRPFELDPGPHVIRASVGGRVKEQSVVVSAGERKRNVTIAFPGGARAVCGMARAPEGSSPSPRATPKARPVPPLVWVLGAAGLVSAGVAAGFGASAFDQKASLDLCKGSCAQADVDSMQRTFLVADVAAIVAVSSLVAAGVLYILR